jgi:hypothetical protein
MLKNCYDSQLFRPWSGFQRLNLCTEFESESSADTGSVIAWTAVRSKNLPIFTYRSRWLLIHRLPQECRTAGDGGSAVVWSWDHSCPSRLAINPHDKPEGYANEASVRGVTGGCAAGVSVRHTFGLPNGLSEERAINEFGGLPLENSRFGLWIFSKKPVTSFHYFSH